MIQQEEQKGKRLKSMDKMGGKGELYSIRTFETITITTRIRKIYTSVSFSLSILKQT
jgi:hypothetical protein